MINSVTTSQTSGQTQAKFCIELRDMDVQLAVSILKGFHPGFGLLFCPTDFRICGKIGNCTIADTKNHILMEFTA